MISAVTLERQVGLLIRTLPRMLIGRDVGAVHDRATDAFELDGGISSKLLTKPDAFPLCVAVFGGTARQRLT